MYFSFSLFQVTPMILQSVEVDHFILLLCNVTICWQMKLWRSFLTFK
jgi:hypothetical protein